MVACCHLKQIHSIARLLSRNTLFYTYVSAFVETDTNPDKWWDDLLLRSLLYCNVHLSLWLGTISSVFCGWQPYKVGLRLGGGNKWWGVHVSWQVIPWDFLVDYCHLPYLSHMVIVRSLRLITTKYWRCTQCYPECVLKWLMFSLPPWFGQNI